MSKWIALASASIAVALAATSGAGAFGSRPNADPGVSANEILIGGTTPLTGEASAGSGTAIGAEAYFKYVNARGGVNGRKITYTYLDDGYDPGRTVQATRQLVQQDRVFAIFNSLGTAQNLAIRPFLNQVGVPQLFIASGYGGWARDASRYPLSMGYIPTYTGEGQVYARDVLAKRPKARIAVLYQDDDYGREMLAGLKKGLKRKAGQIVEQQSYDPTSTDIQSQIAKLKSSRADVFMNFAFGKFAIQAFVYANRLGWKPARTYVNAVAASTTVMSIASEGGTNKRTTGAISAAFFKDPASPVFAKDAGIKLFRSIVKKYIPRGDVRNGYYLAGMASAYSFVDALKKAGKNPTRTGLMKAMLKLDEKTNPFVLRGITVKTSSTDRRPLEQAQLQRWQKTHWVPYGKVLTTPR
jgi:ABC-type branched-subunit amino acid transport system substrate-binding protein